MAIISSFISLVSSAAYFELLQLLLRLLLLAKSSASGRQGAKSCVKAMVEPALADVKWFDVLDSFLDKNLDTLLMTSCATARLGKMQPLKLLCI